MKNQFQVFIPLALLLFCEVVSGITNEIENEFTIIELIIAADASKYLIDQKIKEVSPKIIILMDNKVVGLYKKYQQESGKDDKIPSISVMGVLLDQMIIGLDNAACIYYEIPIVTSVVSLRSILKLKIKKVGVIYRELMDDFIQKNKKYCECEDIELVLQVLPNKGINYKSAIKKGLKKLIKKEKVDFLWIPNDNILLNKEVLRDVWIPLVKKYKKPVITGVERLVHPDFNFGTFAVLPDNISLGIQTAQLIYEAMDNDWKFDEHKVMPPLSVYKIINLKQVKKVFKIKNANVENVDKILE